MMPHLTCSLEFNEKCLILHVHGFYPIYDIRHYDSYNSSLSSTLLMTDLLKVKWATRAVTIQKAVVKIIECMPSDQINERV